VAVVELRDLRLRALQHGEADDQKCADHDRGDDTGDRSREKCYLPPATALLLYVSDRRATMSPTCHPRWSGRQADERPPAAQGAVRDR
jgi:hypothetical protein